MSKMDDIRAKLDAELPPEFFAERNKLKEQEIDDAIQGEVTRVYNEKKGIDANMKLAKTIVDLNPYLPSAFKTKFEVMSINAYFASNIQRIIEDCKKHNIELKLSNVKTNPKKITKTKER